MTRKWNLAAVRRDEERWEEASTFPSSESWQGKVCRFHPAHVLRARRAKSFSIFHLIILLPWIYPLMSYMRPRAPASETPSRRCASLQMCIELFACVTPEYLWDVRDPAAHPKSYQTDTMWHINSNTTLHFTNILLTSEYILLTSMLKIDSYTHPDSFYWQ